MIFLDSYKSINPLNMKNLYLLLMTLLIIGNISAQTIQIPQGTAVIDGIVDAAWNVATPNPITRSFQSEKPTVAGSTWQAMYDDNFFYILVNVIDQGNHWPGWASGGNSWEYDKPEVYWDWNDVLKDGGGPGSTSNNLGHWQLADGFTEDKYGTPITNVGSATINPGGTYCYTLNGQNYVYEMKIPFANFKDKNNTVITKDIAIAKAAIGFDVAIIDQDQGITTARQRAVWMNDGSVDENWNNMDGAGTICLKNSILNVTPSILNISGTNGSTSQITIQSNTNWTASLNQSWLTLSQTSGSNNGTLTLTATKNPQILPRIAKVNISSGGISRIVTVTQNAEVGVPYGTAIIDGIKDAAWDIATPNPITRNFKLEEPTVAGSTWQAMYDDNNFYVLVNVIDQGNHWPGWEAGGDSWLYDKPEIYWDWNEVLKDGVGGGSPNTGHYQFAESFANGQYGAAISVSPSGVCPGGMYAYTLTGQNYVYEVKVPFANFKNKINTVITKDIAIAKSAIGFDVTIIDQDQGITTARQRVNWANDGAVDENWNNMDDAGTLKLIQNTLEISSTSISISNTEGSNGSINVTSNTIWTASSNQTWLTVTPLSKNGNGTLIFTATANPKITTRMATVTILAPGTTSKNLIITQEAGPATLSVLPTNLNIAAMAGSTATFNVTSNTAWSVSSNQTWLTANPSTGTGNGTVTLTTELNPTIVSRTATVTISASGTTSQNITVTQAASPATISVSPTSMNIASAAGSTATFNITSNTSWSVTSNQNWLTASPLTGTGNGTVTLTAELNPSLVSRTAIITISAIGVTSQTVTVMQIVGDATLSVSPTNLNIGATGGSTTTFNVTSNAAWSASSDQTWLAVNPSSGTGNGSVTLTADANPTTSTRIATVSVSATGVTSQTVTITQAAGSATLSVSTSTLSLGSVANSTSTFNITSNTLWTVSSNKSWLTVNPSTGSGNSTITVTVEENPSTTERTATITVTAVGVVSQIITATQSKGIISLSVSPSTLNIESVKNSTASFNVISNISWSVSSDQNWLTVIPVSGSNNGLVSVIADANQTVTERVANVTISADGLTPITVSVVQAAGEASLIVSDESIDIAHSASSSASIKVTSNITWIASSDQSWLSISPNNSVTGDGTITLTATANTGPARNATVTIISLIGVNTITVHQAEGPSSIKSSKLDAVKIYPNPVNNSFKIGGLTGESTIFITNIDGKILLSKEIEKNESIPVSFLAKGIYFIKIQSSEGIINRKLIKE